uniref:Uncharacterized protein n=1 Tax=Panagrolaimus sp. PS1159 TaxID=55785 RepID=A0AC35G9M2_9BILA
MGFSTFFTSVVQCFKKKPKSSKRKDGQQPNSQSNDGTGNNVAEIGSGGYINGGSEVAVGSSAGRNGNGGGEKGNDNGGGVLAIGIEKSTRQPSIRTKKAVTSPTKKPKGGSSGNGKSSGKKNSDEVAIIPEAPGSGEKNDCSKEPLKKSKESAKQKNNNEKPPRVIRRQSDYPALDDVLSDQSESDKQSIKRSSKQSVKQSVKQSIYLGGKKKKQQKGGTGTGEKTLAIDPTQVNTKTK